MTARRTEVELGPEPSRVLDVYRAYAARPGDLLPAVQRAIEVLGYQIVYVVPDGHRVRFRNTQMRNVRGMDLVVELTATGTGTRVAFRGERLSWALTARGHGELTAKRVLQELGRRDETATFAVEDERMHTPWALLLIGGTLGLSLGLFLLQEHIF